MPIDTYEDNRPPRRLCFNMIVPPKERERMLKGQGYSHAEILKGTKQANILRRNRRRSLEMATKHLKLEQNEIYVSEGNQETY